MHSFHKGVHKALGQYLTRECYLQSFTAWPAFIAPQCFIAGAHSVPIHRFLRRSGRLYKRPSQISSKENLADIGERIKKSAKMYIEDLSGFLGIFLALGPLKRVSERQPEKLIKPSVQKITSSFISF